jgi:hypothetical protein
VAAPVSETLLRIRTTGSRASEGKTLSNVCLKNPLGRLADQAPVLLLGAPHLLGSFRDDVLQVPVRLLERLLRGPNLVEHAVERADRLLDLPGAGRLDASEPPAPRDLLHGSCQRLERLEHPPGHPTDGERGEHADGHDDRDDEDEVVAESRTYPDQRDRLCPRRDREGPECDDEGGGGSGAQPEGDSPGSFPIAHRLPSLGGSSSFSDAQLPVGSVHSRWEAPAFSIEPLLDGESG